MLIEQLVSYCHSQYHRPDQCPDCTNECPGSCEECLKAIHFSGTARTYDCPNIANYYVCKYIFKYSSEIDHLIARLKSLRDFTEYSVMSIGCGPCTELAGMLNYVQRSGRDRPVHYVGFELNELWRPVHGAIRGALADYPFPVDVRFVYGDAMQLVRRLNKEKVAWRPNVLVLQYILSDLVKSGADINAFLRSLHEQIISVMPLNSYIILNDINLSDARNYFDRLAALVEHDFKTWVFQGHYNNVWRNAYPYGILHASNALTSTVPPEIAEHYNPWMYCTSANMVIKKQATK